MFAGALTGGLGDRTCLLDDQTADMFCEPDGIDVTSNPAERNLTGHAGIKGLVVRGKAVGKSLIGSASTNASNGIIHEFSACKLLCGRDGTGAAAKTRLVLPSTGPAIFHANVPVV